MRRRVCGSRRRGAAGLAHRLAQLPRPARAGILLLLARGRVAPAFLLAQGCPGAVAAALEPGGTVAATLALTLYLYILLVHWIVLLPRWKSRPEAGR